MYDKHECLTYTCTCILYTCTCMYTCACMYVHVYACYIGFITQVTCHIMAGPLLNSNLTLLQPQPIGNHYREVPLYGHLDVYMNDESCAIKRSSTHHPSSQGWAPIVSDSMCLYVYMCLNWCSWWALTGVFVLYFFLQSPSSSASVVQTCHITCTCTCT